MQTLRTLLGWLMGLFYLTAGINHFWNPGFYLNIMPPYLPWHEALVYLSGMIEIVQSALSFTGCMGHHRHADRLHAGAYSHGDESAPLFRCS